MSGEFPLWNQLDVMDTYTYLLICPFAMLASFSLVVVQLSTKSLRKQPGDLITMIAISEFFLSLHWFMSALRTDYLAGGIYNEDSTFCKINQYIAIVAGSLDTVYNVAFLVYTLFALQNSLQQTKIPKKSIHAFAIGITTLIVISSKLGRNTYGTCSVKITTIGVSTGAFVVIFVIGLGLYALKKTEGALPILMNKEMGQLRRDFLGYYKSYFKALMMIYSVIFFSYCCQIFAQNQNNPDFPGKRNIDGVFFNLGRFGNTAKAMLPLLLFFIRTSDPALAKSLGIRFRGLSTGMNFIAKAITLPGIVNNKESHPDDSVDSQIVDGTLQPTDQSPRGERSDTMLTENKQDLIEQELNTETDDMHWISLLPSKMKYIMTKTFVASIYAVYPDVLSKTNLLGHDIMENERFQSIQFDIKDEQYRKCIQQEEGIANCSMVVCCPTIFKRIIKASPRKINFLHSLNIFKNAQAIRSAGEDKGGASGALQLKTHDDQLIIKTMSHEDFVEFKRILPAYARHLLKYPNSLISRIYGMFEFTFEGSDKPIRMMLMECIAVFPKEDILRKYDLKGSTYSRQVLSDEMINSIDKHSPIPGTLKDLDFSKIEHTISTKNKEDLGKLASAMESDARFFQENNLIDYSLLVSVIRIRPENEQILKQEIQAGAFRLMVGKSIASQGEEEYLFMVGIIDYLQRYTWSKSFERIFKKFRNCKPSLETSSQPPKKYASRFTKFFQTSFH
jgi:Phosphatidylinositol-4-phosphate 5-Kinase